jgi:hypothetical protein
MPRKKTVQPLPAESVDFGDVVVEVWEDGVYPIGRGLHKQAEFIELCSRIFEFVVPVISKNSSQIIDNKSSTIHQAEI